MRKKYTTVAPLRALTVNDADRSKQLPLPVAMDLRTSSKLSY